MKKLVLSSVVWLLAIAVILVTQIVGAVLMITMPDSTTIVTYLIMTLVQIANVIIVLVAVKKRGYSSSYKIAKIKPKNHIC